MEFFDIIGLIAGFLTTISFIPQVHKSFITKSVKDFSWLYLLIFGTGVFFWFVYGISLNSIPILLANIVTFILVLSLTIMKIKYK
jgi:MtN3 and saliva related transmembrane protein